jgi:hypothetical protein
MNEDEQIEIRLWNYIDNAVNAEEKMQIEELLKNNLRWQRLYKQLTEIHQMMNNVELDEPSMRFTRNVMEEISTMKVAPATKNYINKKIISAIAAFFIFLIGSLLIYCLANINWTMPQNNTAPFDIKKIDVNDYLSQPVLNVFLMLNVVLVLILLDHYLAKKRNHSKHKHI